LRYNALSALLILSAFAQCTFADAVRDIRTPVTRPIAPQGGVMMLPLTAQRAGDNWPGTIALTLADGSNVDGVVVWIEPAVDDASRPRRWTTEPGGLEARPIRPEDDTATVGPGSPWLLAALPEGGDGPIRLGRQELQPTWRDPNIPYTRQGLPGPDRPVLQPIAGPDRPDPDSPFAYWRWVLLADRMNMRPHAPDRYGETGSLLARHYADLWRIGLANLGQHTPSMAATCRDLLTRICADRASAVRLAAWITDPVELQTLQAILLALDAPGEVVTRNALAWADARTNLLVWPEAAFGDRVRMAIVNRSTQPVVARLAWQVLDETPIAVELEPGVLTRVHVDRPPLPTPDPFGLTVPEEAGAQALELRAELQTVRSVFGPRRTKARPPGVFLPPARPALTLAEVEARRLLLVPGQRGTHVQLRRLGGRWEIFIECRRTAAASASETGDPLRRFATWAEVRGIEAVTLFIGGEDSPTAVLTVPEQGWHRLFAGANDGTLQVHRRSHDDRWYCRIVLPESWLDVNEEDAASILIGCRRAHGDGDAVETTPNTSAPWRQAPARAGVDLSSWDDLP
jgi:hypothetical protein